MLTISPARPRSDGLSRRGFLRAGSLAVGGLSLADVFRLRARAAQPPARGKSVIMIVLAGGPSHIDMYDMKPTAPAEYRGEFKPIPTKVPGFQICEHMPLQAQVADKLAVVRNLRFSTSDHPNLFEIYTGFGPRVSAAGTQGPHRPAFGSVVSRLRPGQSSIPYVAMLDDNPAKENFLRQFQEPAYLGAGHQPFIPTGPALANLSVPHDLTVARQADRRSLLLSFDQIRRDIDARGDLAAMDAFAGQALDLVTSNRVRDALDLSKEPDQTKAKYASGRAYAWAGEKFIQARRLVEAGVPVVTLFLDGWDHHGVTGNIFKLLSTTLPALDRLIYALVTDLHERGLDRDVAVLVWGEFGRAPLLSRAGGNLGRNHWPGAGFALLAGGGLRMGQTIGQTDDRGGHPKGHAYTPQNLLATMYHHLGIDPATTLPDHQGRPMYLLDDREPIADLL